MYTLLHFQISERVPVEVRERIFLMLRDFELQPIEGGFGNDPGLMIIPAFSHFRSNPRSAGRARSTTIVRAVVRHNPDYPMPNALAPEVLIDVAAIEDRLLLLGLASRIASMERLSRHEEKIESLSLSDAELSILWTVVALGTRLTEARLSRIVEGYPGIIRRWLRMNTCRPWRRLFVFGMLLRVAFAIEQFAGSVDRLSEELEFSTPANFRRFIRQSTGLTVSKLRQQCAVHAVVEVIQSQIGLTVSKSSIAERN